MRIHVLYAHPLSDSFAAAVHGRVLEALRRAGHDVDDFDLYADGFDPILGAAERRTYNSPGANLGAIQGYVARLQAADALVLCFPTWWYGMPAILKGYFDRVWVPGVAFHLPPGGGAIRPGLLNIRKLGVVTTYGSPWWLVKLLLRDPVRAVVLGGFRRLLAPGAKAEFLALYDIDGATPRRCRRFLDRVTRTFERF